MKPSLPVVALVVIILGLTVSVLLLTNNKKPEADPTPFLQERTETVVLPSHTEYLKSSLKVRPNAKYAGSYKYKSMTPQMLGSQASQHKVKNESNTGKAWDTLHCERWAVVTTINAPTTSVQKQAQVSAAEAKLIDGVHSGWCLLVVADTGSPDQYILDVANNKYVYLSISRQRELADTASAAQKALYKALPWGHVGRKNAGYLYAIRHGARYIYDFDDDMLLLSKHHTITVPGESVDRITKSVTTSTTFTARVPSLPYDAEVFNPFPLFDANHNPSWPRGFPSERILRNISTHDVPIDTVQVTLPSTSIGVVQYLANHDPDVDSLYRLVRPLPLDFPLHGVVPLVLPGQRSAEGKSSGGSGGSVGSGGGGSVGGVGGVGSGGNVRGGSVGGTGANSVSSVRVGGNDSGGGRKLSDPDDIAVSVGTPTSNSAATSASSTISASSSTTCVSTSAGDTTTPAAVGGVSRATTTTSTDSTGTTTSDTATNTARSSASAIAPYTHTVYAPFNSQSTLHTYNALFALLLPLTSHPRVSDIWRSYVAQRCFAEIGVRVAYHSPISAHIRTPKESDLPDMLSELPLYADSLAFIHLLRAFHGSSSTVAGRIEELYVHLYEHGFVGLEDVNLVQKWIAALIECGYVFPALV